MIGTPPPTDDHVDDHVDDELATYLDLAQPRSFFLFAGAGSGKTRSLVAALRRLRETSGMRLRLKGQQVAVITYTNAACDEIKGRMDHDPLFHVSTIHSFVWDLIGGLTNDTRHWLAARIQSDIAELQQEERKGRPGTKASAQRQRELESKKRRLDLLSGIKRFTYSPTGDNRGRDALSHSEVLAIGATLLTDKPLMRSLLLGRFPVLLIDESQDTNAGLMDAFFAVQSANKASFCVGLFGDTMQRIYADGKKDLGVNLPQDWARPAKRMNHRCPRRVVALINRIRSEVDTQEQWPRSDAPEGHARLFIRHASTQDKFAVEAAVRDQMAGISGDIQWKEPQSVKTLILEHHMAAKRLGFAELFLPLYRIDSFKVSLLEGDFAPLRLFTERALPLSVASRANDRFAEAAIVRKHSALLSEETLAAAGTSQSIQLKKAQAAVEALTATLNQSATDCLSVLQCIAQHGLFEIPEALLPFASGDNAASAPGGTHGTGTDSSEELNGLGEFLKAPFAQVQRYAEYVSGRAPLDTHQGVKGLEFPRVLVVMDDGDAAGFLFSFDKLLGAKEKSKTDLENERSGKDTGIDRTRRLFYVTCSRSQSSLALLAYTIDPKAVRRTAIERGWFSENEIDGGN